jgi:Tol biopolymer transport system component
MRIPFIPIIVAVALLSGVWYFFNATRSGERTIDVPRLTRIADIDGIETEVSLTPDGNRCAVISSGDLWVLNILSGERKQLTRTPEMESFPAWTPDGKRITFTRGANTFAINPETGSEELFRANATSLSWSVTSRTTFVRERALWVANPNDQREQKLVDADPISEIDIRTPRFSPDSLQIAFIKTQLGIRGEVWTADALNGGARPLVSDRATENPLDVGWARSCIPHESRGRLLDLVHRL